MARLSRFTQLSGVAVVCFIFASAGYMMYLIYSQYRVQEKLRNSFTEHTLRESEKRALAIGYFLSERLYDLSTLSERREISLYYENKALGMSLEYGLGASINAVNDVLLTFREKRLMDGRRVFERIAYQDISGRTLFESGGTDAFGTREAIFQRSRDSRKRIAVIRSEKMEGREYVVVSSPFMFKGMLNGRLSGWIPAEVICHHFAEISKENSRFNLMVLHGRYLFGEHHAREFMPGLSLPDPAGMKPGIVRTISVSTGAASHNVRALLTVVPNTPFALASFFRDDSGSAGPPPRRPFFVLMGIGLALLTGGIAFYRASMRSAVLETRLTETRLRERIVEEKNDRLRKLLTAVEQSCSSVVITNVDGDIEYVNPHFSKVTGYSAEDVHGKNPRILQSSREPMEKYRELWKTVLNGKSWSGEFLNRKKNGDFFWERANIAPVIDEQGVISSLIAIKEDISDRKLAEQELLTAKDAAEAASRAKSAFLANMSHEIRTPLNGIIGMTQLMLKDELTDKQRKQCESVHYSAELLLSIINDVLDFSKIEAGRLDLEKVPFDIRSAVSRTVELFTGTARDKGISLHTAFESAVPRIVRGDPMRLRQILLNLVGNAVKFTQEGEISVLVSCEETGSGQALLGFQVADTGIGIADESLERIFDSFTQADSSTTRKFGGTGLGLSITRQLVEMMNGSISVESSVGRGSVFRFSLSMEKDNASEETPCSAAGDSPQLYDRVTALRSGVASRILVAEDNVVNQEVCRAMLDYLGYRCDTVENGVEAVRAVESTAYDLVFMDYEMPDMDGLEATRIIREREAGSGRRTTIVALPGHAMEGYRERCIENGMDDYLTKPFTMEAIQDILERRLPKDRDYPETYTDQQSDDGSLCDQYRTVMSAVV